MLSPINEITKPPMARLDPDGNFGPKTKAMVKEFQLLNMIKDDGIVGPITRLHLFPYVKFSANLRARGQFLPYVPTGIMQRQGTPFGFQPVLDDKPKDEPDKPQGFRFELFIAKGVEVKLVREKGLVVWPPRFGDAEQTITVGATLLRLGRLEVTGELEASKPLKPKRGDNWEWEGFVKASYEAVSPVGPVSPLSPFIQITPQSPLPGSAGIEAKIEILKNILELSIDGQGSLGYDSDKGRVNSGVSVSGGLQFNLDILFQSHPPSQP
jgi:hypothetical protein